MSVRKSIKHAVRRWALERGYIVEPRRVLSTVALAERLKQIFADYDIRTVIDVGANLGQYGMFLRERVGFTGRIESFEPIPALAEKLFQTAVPDGRWAIHQMALGAEPGRQTIHVTAQPTYSSFHPIADEYAKKIAVAELVDVPVARLDDQLFGKVDLQHTYLKLDTQGFDLEVLKGATKLVSEIPALQTEVSFQPFYRRMPNYQESLDTFARYGFVVADFFLAAEDEDRAAMEFDCLMVRPSAHNRTS